MTTREPDRLNMQACAVIEAWNAGADSLSDLIAAALRQAAEQALDRAAQTVEATYPEESATTETGLMILTQIIHAARNVRALASPAAAPAAETMTDEEARRLSTFDAQLAKAGCEPLGGSVTARCNCYARIQGTRVEHKETCPMWTAPPSEPVAPAPDRLRWEAVDMSDASTGAACYEIHDDRGDIVALCFQQEDAEHIAALHNIAVFGTASPVAHGKEK